MDARDTPAGYLWEWATKVELLREAGTSIVGDILGRLGGAVGLRRYDNGASCLLGTALTVQTRSGDNLAILAALSKAKAGDVLVVDGGACLERALVGDLARTYAIQRGVTGFILNGAIRDVVAFRGPEQFGCFARGTSHRGPTKQGPGKIAVPIAIGDQVIRTGDIVMADEDGMLSFAAERAEEMCRLVEKRLAAESKIRAEIMTGAASQSWLDAALAEAPNSIS